MKTKTKCSEEINISDILKDFPKHKKDIQGFSRDRFSGLLTGLNEVEVPDLSEREVENLIKFLNVIHEDEKYSYLLKLIDHSDTRFGTKGGIDNPNVLSVLRPFVKFLKIMREQGKS